MTLTRHIIVLCKLVVNSTTYVVTLCSVFLSQIVPGWFIPTAFGLVVAGVHGRLWLVWPV